MVSEDEEILILDPAAPSAHHVKLEAYSFSRHSASCKTAYCSYKVFFEVALEL
jgi:hypothetical protein